MYDFIRTLNYGEIVKAALTIFIIIDIIGCIPIIIKTKRVTGSVHASKITAAAGGIGLLFLVFGQKLLMIYELELPSLKAAGGVILCVFSVELLFDVEINKITFPKGGSSPITPLGFPIIIGPCILMTFVLLREELKLINIMIGFLLNLLPVYVVLRYVEQIERALGPLLIRIITKVMSMVLLAMGIQLIKDGFAV